LSWHAGILFPVGLTVNIKRRLPPYSLVPLFPYFINFR